MADSRSGLLLDSAVAPNSARPGSAQVFTGDHDSFRTHESEVEFMERQKTGTFKYCYADYDISEMPSYVTSRRTSISSIEGMPDSYREMVRDDRWYDKSSAACLIQAALETNLPTLP